MKLRTHKDLNVWKESINLTKNIYTATRSFPKDEIYGLTSQIRRSSVSVPSNIAEGAARRSKKELNYTGCSDNLFDQMDSVRRMLLGLIKNLQN